MSAEERSAQPEATCGCVTKILGPCWNFLSYFNTGSTVCPTTTIAPQNSEFFMINCKKKLRVIHVKPEASQFRVNKHSNERNTLLSRRLSEDYWFTRWSKPLKLNRCSCSFRKSRISLPPTAAGAKCEFRTTEKTTLGDVSKKRLLIETFVEQLIHETFHEVFSEFVTNRNQSQNDRSAKSAPENNGFVNLSYENCADEDEGVVLRKRQPNAEGKDCSHRKSPANKTVVMLFHGIGSSADVWWIVMRNLIAKGFEVVAPDMLGHGFSSSPNKPNAYSFKSFVDHAVSLFDHYVGCDESKKCIIIGHSFGCSLATAVYKFRAQQIIQLILISGGGPTPLATPVQYNQSYLIGCTKTLLQPLLLCGVKRYFKHFIFRACKTYSLPKKKSSPPCIQRGVRSVWNKVLFQSQISLFIPGLCMF